MEIALREKPPCGLSLLAQSTPRGLTRISGRLQLQCLIRAAAITPGFCLEGLAISDGDIGIQKVNFDSCVTYLSMTALSQEDRPLAKVAFKNIGRLSWELPNYDAKGFVFEPMLRDGHVNRILALMPSLEDLTLKRSRRQSRFPLPIAYTVTRSRSDRLRSVTLNSSEFEEDEFIEFVTHHANSLRFLSLNQFALQQGTLRSFLTRLRDGLNLENLLLVQLAVLGTLPLSNEHYTISNIDTGRARNRLYGEAMDDIDTFVTKKTNDYLAKVFCSA